VTALIVNGVPDGSRHHRVVRAKDNGVTTEDLTHAAFYAGWPRTLAAFRMAKGVCRS
jgi:4-carboxymuconolactone decarboxylase